MKKEAIRRDDVKGIVGRIAADGHAMVTTDIDIVWRTENGETENGETDGFDIIISDESVDSHGTVFKSEGWSIEDFNRSPLVTWQHPWLDDEDPDVFIGLGPVRIEDRKLVSSFTWEPGDTNDIVRKLKNKVKSGMIKSASIVARVEDGRYGIREKGEDPDVFYFTRQKLITYGIVAFPSNGNAVIKGRTESGEKEEGRTEKGERRTENGEREYQRNEMIKTMAKINSL